MSTEVEKSATALPAEPMPPGVCLRRSLQSSELFGPESVQEVTHGFKSICANQEQMPCAIALLGDKACFA